jgi:tellurium resistance protein TerD
MSLPFKKGDCILLQNEFGKICNQLHIGFGWGDVGGIEIDAFTFLMGVENKIYQDGSPHAESNIVFYNSNCRISRHNLLSEKISIELNDINKYSTYSNYIEHTWPASPNFEVIGPISECEWNEGCDDEFLHINLDRVSSDIFELKLILSIYNAKERNQNFDQIDDLYIRLIDRNTNKEILKYYCFESSTNKANAIEIGRVFKKKNQWFFESLNEQTKSGIDHFLAKYSSLLN